MSLLVIPECHADTSLIKHLVRDDRCLRHASSNHRVAAYIKNLRGRYNCLIGIVDYDKSNRPSLFENDYVEIRNGTFLIIKKHPHFNEYVVYLRPAIEKFLLANLEAVNSSMSDFELPNELKDLCKIFKAPGIETNPQYKNLLRHLETTQAPGIVELGDFIRSKR